MNQSQFKWMGPSINDFEWEWSIVRDISYLTIAKVEAKESDGSLRLRFINESQHPISVLQECRQMFYDKFPDWDKAHPERIASIVERRVTTSRREYELQKAREASIPRCPNCRSTNIRPISTSKRIGSTVMFGLASSTIGKSYECLSCKYKW